MRWKLLGALLTAASVAQRSPEREALVEFGREVYSLERIQAATPSSR